MKEILLCILLAISPHHIAIKVSPMVLTQGGHINLRCYVDRFPENRKLLAGVKIEDMVYDSSERQLDGEESKRIWDFTFKNIPCDATLAYCTVMDNSQVLDTATARLTIAGCDGNKHRSR